MNYRMAKLAYESCGRKIYNATAGGKLEIFPRVSYDSVFRYQLPESYVDTSPSSSPDTVEDSPLKESLLFLPNHGLVNIDTQMIQLGLDNRVKEVRLRSLKTNSILNKINVDIENQKIDIAELLKFNGVEKQFLLDVLPEGADWVSLGKFVRQRNLLFGTPIYRIVGGLRCRALHPKDGCIAAVFRADKDRILLNLFTTSQSVESQNNGHRLIAPMNIGSLNVIGYNQG